MEFDLIEEVDLRSGSWFPWIIYVLLLNLLISSSQAFEAQSENNQILDTQNYPALFEWSRNLLKIELSEPDHKIKSKYTGLVESDLIEKGLLLPSGETKVPLNATTITSAQRRLLDEILAEEKSHPDPSKHLRLIPPHGAKGYSELQLHVNHPYYFKKDEKSEAILVPAEDLAQVWKDFFLKAKREIIFNVYEFDLSDVADVLILQASRGVEIYLGIDQDVIKKKPRVESIYNRLMTPGSHTDHLHVVSVDSTHLNHQKMGAIDWHDEKGAQVLFSSGNLTQSCLDPQGDLKGLIPSRLDQKPEDAVPNANNIITMKSWLLANLVFHELSKTLGDGFRLRGAEFPKTGAYQVTGEQIENPRDLLSEARPEHSVVITFTPGGGYKDVGRNLIAPLIRDNQGPLRLIQFQFSSEVIANAIEVRAIEAYRKSGNFDFIGIGDRMAALQWWSQFLRLSGIHRDENTKKGKRGGGRREIFSSLENSNLARFLSPSQFADFKSHIFMAPDLYGPHSVQLKDGSKRKYESKVHHKVLSVGDFAIVGSSFNFSESAQENNEQILIFHEPELARRVEGMAEWLAHQSQKSIETAVFQD